METNNFNFLLIVYKIFITNPVWQGALLSMLIAALRVLYDDNNTTFYRLLIEALLCGALALCVGSFVEIYDLPKNSVIPMGGAIGLIGFTTLRDKLLDILNRKTNKDD